MAIRKESRMPPPSTAADWPVLCFGDSLTYGPPGIPFIRYFRHRDRYRNLGVGSDTLTGMTQRILPCLEDPDNREFIIGIGTNDLLLPHMEGRSEPWRLTVDLMVAHGKIILRDLDFFVDGYTSLMDRVVAAGKRATVFGLPCIGEDTGSELNRQADIYNHAIQFICREREIPFVDFKRYQQRKIRRRGGNNTYLLSDDPSKAIRDSVWTTLLPLADKVSDRRGLVMTVDGVHLNHASARLLARLLERARGIRGGRLEPDQQDLEPEQTG